MALPPEKISVKRRREEPAIETFYLQDHDTHRAKKSRTDGATSGFQFRLIRDGTLLPRSRQQPDKTQEPRVNGSAVSDSSNGIPTVRATAPGDEIADFVKFKKQHEAASGVGEATGQGRLVEKDPVRLPPAIASNARRFHLTRNISSSYDASTIASPRFAGRSNGVRPPLPTFVERQQSRDSKQIHTAVDQATDNAARSTGHGVSESHASQLSDTAKIGNSISDPPGTWNHDSDQLADELAALAMAMDPDHEDSRDEPKPEPIPAPASSMQKPRHEEEFIYETYERMPYDSTDDTTMIDAPDLNVGVLVIGEEDEDLWQEYMENDDDEEDWDEEDSNAEDNPANDYPDEEVSSDDEYDRDAYRYYRDYDDDYVSDEE
ncbi:uncharacterized protein AB675_9551 [Cyphellophora attinorum]|uniref:Transcription factor Iwr1 domain-containing protein n=1 Tax=Cyphellophora attinorum TaxID=1664694 RepID=A0A0N1H7Q8_9EURO|nr:uncharacterized protein AB675_9551 [Phialophora attinorum]KPI42626.1 hypothetical protein AB675_9551 [Phialophora attinorum]